MLKTLLQPVSEFAKKNKFFSWLLIVILISTILKFIFVFEHTDYRSYLTSDMGGYWTRAFERFNGEHFNLNQWALWPPLFHIILSGIFQITHMLNCFHLNLEIVLGTNIILSSVSVLYLYMITLKLSGNRLISFITASLYAFNYYTFYFNAFILSENFAVPIVIASVYYLFLNRPGYYFLSGILLAIATGMRPGFGIFAVPYGLYALFQVEKSTILNSVFFRRVLKGALFSAGFLIIIFLIIAENNRISQGNVRGLAASGGLNKYFSFTKTYEVQCRFDGYYYVIIPPGTIRNPENGKLITDEPIYNTKYFNGLTKKYIREHPGVVLRKFSDIGTLYFGVLFPSMNSVLWFNILREPTRWLVFLLSLLVLFSIFISKKQLHRLNYLLILSVIFFSILTCYLFNSEHRYIFGFMFALHPIAVVTIFRIFSDFKSVRKKLVIFFILITLPVLIYAGISQYRRWTIEEKINAVVYTQELSDPEAFYVDEINFPFSNNFTHQTLGLICNSKPFTANITGSFTMEGGGFMEVMVYCEEGFELKIDSNIILMRGERADEKEITNIIELPEGTHTFELTYYHNDFDAGIKVMYSPVYANDPEKYFFGENSGPVKFLSVKK